MKKTPPGNQQGLMVKALLRPISRELSFDHCASGISSEPLAREPPTPQSCICWLRPAPWAGNESGCDILTEIPCAGHMQRETFTWRGPTKQTALVKSGWDFVIDEYS